MDDYELLPSTPAQSQMALLAFAGIVGGGLIAYHLGQGIKDGDIFATTPVPENASAGPVAMIGGLTMFAFMVKAAVKEVGWKPLVLGSVGIVAGGGIIRALRG